ncbi:MAG: hypothetical protein WCF04_04855 [Candidatus Nanopelagicales bacterium]
MTKRGSVGDVVAEASGASESAERPAESAERPARVWDLAGAAADVRHRPRLRFVLGPRQRIEFEEGEPGESHVAMVYPEIRLSYPYDGADEAARTEITVASACCALFRTSTKGEPLIEVDDELSFIADAIGDSDWLPYWLDVLHVYDLVVDPFWRGGGLGPAFVALIANRNAEAATVEPAPVRTVRSGGGLDARYYRGASSEARSKVGKAWERAGFLPIFIDPEWAPSFAGRNSYWVRLEDAGRVADARRLLADARRVASHPDVYEWHRQHVRSMQRSAKRAAVRARTRVREPLTPAEASGEAADVLYRRMCRLLYDLKGEPGADTILFDGAHLQMRSKWEYRNGRVSPVLRVELALHSRRAPVDLESAANPVGAAVGEVDVVAGLLNRVGTPVRAEWKAGLPAWCIEYQVVAPRIEDALSKVPAAVVAALVDCLGLPGQAVLDAVLGARLGPERWSQPGWEPSCRGGVVADFWDLELDYLDFVLTTRRHREHFSPLDSDVPARFFVVVPDEPTGVATPLHGDSGEHSEDEPRVRIERADATGEALGDLVALAPLSRDSEEVGWYRHTPDGWIPDPTVPHRLAARPAERLRAVPQPADTQTDSGDGAGGSSRPVD